MIAPGNILQDDLILELARRLNIGYGNEISELILGRPQELAQKASRALQCHIAYIGSNDFGEEIYRVDAEAEAPTHAGWEIDREMPCADAKASPAVHRRRFNPFGALRRLFVATRSFLGNTPQTYVVLTRENHGARPAQATNELQPKAGRGI